MAAQQVSTPSASYDVIIAGGGPGGSAAAAFLAREGKRVLVLEKEHFPRFHVGESLLPYGNDVLCDLGVIDKIEAAGFLPKYGAEFCTSDRSRRLRFWFSKNLAPKYERAFQVERAKFDHLLLNHARDLGAEVHEGAKVKTLERPSENEVCVTWEKDGATHTASGAWLIDASGRDAFAAQALGFKRVATQPTRRVAIFGHFKGVFRNEGKAANHITIVRYGTGWFWFIPIDAEKTSVGMVIATTELRASKQSPEEAFAAAVAGHEELRFRMEKSERVGQLYSTGDYSYRHERFASDRVILVGDAAGFIDPIFSSGVMLALKSARRAAQLILAAGAQPLAAAQQKKYTTEVTQWMTVYSRMITAFYDRAGFEIFMNPAPILQMPKAVAHVVGGDTELSLGHRLRLEAFYFVCWLQRWFRIVPRLNFQER